MQAKPGRPKQSKKVTVSKFVAPPAPDNLTEAQKKFWGHLCDNPLLQEIDEAALYEFMDCKVMHDQSVLALREQGMWVDDAKGSIKKHPAYQVYKERPIQPAGMKSPNGSNAIRSLRKG